MVSIRKEIWKNLSMVSSENIHFLLVYYRGTIISEMHQRRECCLKNDINTEATQGKSRQLLTLDLSLPLFILFAAQKYSFPSASIDACKYAYIIHECLYIYVTSTVQTSCILSILTMPSSTFIIPILQMRLSEIKWSLQDTQLVSHKVEM